MADGLFDQFKEWYEKRHDYARAWKARTGGQVVATMCTYTRGGNADCGRHAAGARAGRPRTAERHRAAHLRHVLSVLPRLPGAGPARPLRLLRGRHADPVVHPVPPDLQLLAQQRADA